MREKTVHLLCDSNYMCVYCRTQSICTHDDADDDDDDDDDDDEDDDADDDDANDGDDAACASL